MKPMSKDEKKSLKESIGSLSVEQQRGIIDIL